MSIVLYLPGKSIKYVFQSVKKASGVQKVVSFVCEKENTTNVNENHCSALNQVHSKYES